MMRLLTARDIAERLQCSRSYAYLLLRTKMRHEMHGRLVRVSEEEFQRYRARRRAEPLEALAREPAARPLDGLIRPIKPRTKPRVHGGDR